jgi:hypothetical protein
METVILELNQRFSEYSSEGEYRIQLSQPTIVNPGDQLAFRMASLDTDKTEADTIVIDADTQLTMTYSIYDFDFDLRDKAVDDQSAPWAGDASGGDAGGNQPSFDYYAAYTENQTEELYQIYANIVGFIPPLSYQQGGGSYIVGGGGSFDNTDPVNNLVIVFSYMDPSGNVQYLRTTGDNTKQRPPSNSGTLYQVDDSSQRGGSQLQLYVDNPPDYDSIQRAGPDYGPIVFRKGTLTVASTEGAWPGAYLSPSNKKLVFPTGAQWPGGAGTTAGFTGEFKFTPTNFTFQFETANAGKINRSLDTRLFNLTLPAGRYDPNSMAVLMTQLLSDAKGLVASNPAADDVYAPSNPLLMLTTDPINEDLVFRRVDFSAGTTQVTFSNQNTYRYYNIDAGQIEPYYCGSSVVSVEYGKAGNVFQLSYNHMPLNNPSRPGEQDIGVYYYYRNNNVRYKVARVASGIVIHDLQPASFWQGQLGLREKLIVPLLNDSQGYQYYTAESLQGKLTEGFQSLSTFLLPATETGTNTYNNFRKLSPSPPANNPTYIDCTGLSKAIIGETVNLNTSGSFYLIEVLNVFRRTGAYLDANENRISIAAIVSTAYSEANVVTAFADSGIPYIHSGEPYLITDAVVRILDPVTKEPVRNLGPNNTIWIEINKAVQREIPTQPPTQAEERGGEKAKM